MAIYYGRPFMAAIFIYARRIHCRAKNNARFITVRCNSAWVIKTFSSLNFAARKMNASYS